MSGDTGGCSILRPRAAAGRADGTTFVYSELDKSIYALDLSLEVKSGWPFEPATPLEVARPGLDIRTRGGLLPDARRPGCRSGRRAVSGPQALGTAYVGGSLIAVDAKGRVRSGWPVTPRVVRGRVLVGRGRALMGRPVRSRSSPKRAATSSGSPSPLQHRSAWSRRSSTRRSEHLRSLVDQGDQPHNFGGRPVSPWARRRS